MQADYKGESAKEETGVVKALSGVLYSPVFLVSVLRTGGDVH